MDTSIVNLVSDEETPSPVRKKIKDSPGGKGVRRKSPVSLRREKEVKNEPLSEVESKQNIKSEVKKEPISKKRPKKEQLVSPKSKKAKIEPDKNNKKSSTSVKSEVNSLKDEPGQSHGESSLGKTNNSESKLHIDVEWRVEDVISEKLLLPTAIVKNVVNLFENDNTIPFIARYRKEKTGNMEPEMLRRVKDNYERLLTVKQKIVSVSSLITKMEKMTPIISAALRNSRTLNEIDHIYAQFKPSGARTWAEKARALGLDKPAMAMLEGTYIVCPEDLVNSETESVAKVLQGLQHIIADVISKNKVVLDTLRELYERNKNQIYVESKKAKTTEKKPEKKTSAPKQGAAKQANEETAEKFQLYFSYKTAVSQIKPHQVLAILRGESLKVLSVKIDTPNWFLNKVKQTCSTEWLRKGIWYPGRESLLIKSMEDAYTRLMQPYIIRQVRTNLTEEAHHASIEVFGTNLKQLLLVPPLRGNVVMGIDPGFRHGCKVAVINSNGDILKTDVLYIHVGGSKEKEKQMLRSLLCEYNCELIALGNGTACRETELWIGSLISQGYFKPLDVKYTIVDEQGVSIYSCSPVAKQEFPDLEPNVISAVSLARRIQDPLSELVKVEPKHLGVGMYQHDIPEKKLSKTLDEVVVECVSFVGVDVNTASEILLRHVAGLNTTRASNIIDWRSKNGPFLNRDQLHSVKGIGPKSFEQCAGFLRIISETSSLVCFGDLKGGSSPPKSKKKTVVATESNPNPLDRTWIHPEMYTTVYCFLELCGVTLSEFGSPQFLKKIQLKVEEIGLQNITSKVDTSEGKMKLIIDGLSQKPDYDIRSQFHKPLFRSSICTVQDLKVGNTVTGRVQNVTHFGAFVDIGVGRDGLIHVSQMRRINLQIGDRVEVLIKNVDIGTKVTKISLGLVRTL